MDLTEQANDAHFSPRLVTVDRAARLLGIGRTTLYELIAEGELQVVHIHRSARIPIDAIDAYVARLREARRPTGRASARLRRVGNADT